MAKKKKTTKGKSKDKTTKKKSRSSKKEETRKKRGKSTRRSKPVETDDDEEEKPRSRRKGKASRSGRTGGFYSNLRKKTKRTRKRFQQRSEFWKPEEGKNYFRAIPFEHKGKQELYVENVRHWRCPVGAEKPAILRCKGEEDCPICEILPELSSELADGYKGVGPSASILINGVVRDGKKDRHVVAELPVSVVTGKKGMEGFFDEDDPDFVDVFDAEDGYDFVIVKEKSDKGRISYSVRLANKSTPIGMDVKPRDLYEIVTKFDEDALYEKAVENLLDEEDDRGRTARKNRDDDDDDYDEDYDDEEEDDDDDDDEDGD